MKVFNFNFSKITVFSTGIDLRTNLADSSLKMHIRLKDYPEKIRKVKFFDRENKKMLNEIASNYYRSLPTKENILFAITLAKRSNEIDNMYNSNYLIAKLYNKLKDVKNAKIYAKRAFDVATEKKII